MSNSSTPSPSPNPTRYESTAQPGLFFWAEPNDIDGGATNCGVSQADGFPATAADKEWYARFADADEIARKLADGTFVP